METLRKLNKVDYNDIKNIFNASYRKRDTVTQFGQSIPNPNHHNSIRVDLIDSLDIILLKLRVDVGIYSLSGIIVILYFR